MEHWSIGKDIHSIKFKSCQYSITPVLHLSIVINQILDLDKLPLDRSYGY